MQARWALTGVLAFALVAGGRNFVTKAATPTVPVDDLGPTASPTYARAVSASGRAVGFGYDAGPSGFGFEQSTAPAFVPLPSGASELFAYVECESEERWSAIAKTEICQRWWQHMREIMSNNPDNSPVSRELTEVFHVRRS